MSEGDKAAKNKTMPTGRKKGGTIFPRVSLKQALNYAEKLVSKTHTGPQPESTILAGVFGNAGGVGQIRASALKQFGLLEGDRNAYKATDLAKSISAAPDAERPELFQRAFLKPKVFQQVFETFHGDTVTAPKIRQRLLGLKVHPDSADSAVTIFLDSAEVSGLGIRDNDGIRLANASSLSNGDQSGGAGFESEESSEPPSEETTATEIADGSKASKVGEDKATEKPASAKKQRWCHCNAKR